MSDNTGTATGASGYGQFEPSDGAHPFNVQKFIIEQAINKVVTAKIVRVTGVFNAEGGAVGPNDTGQIGQTGRLSVQPLVALQDGQGNTQPHGIVNGIPFSRSQGGANAVIMDPQIGDIGIMIVADRDSSAVKNSRDGAAPGSKRTFDIADGMYVCSLLNTEVPVQYVRFKEDGIELVDKNGNSIITNAEGMTITSPGTLTLNAKKIVTHATDESAWDVNGTGFVYSLAGTQIDTYTNGVPSTGHPPMPPKVPT